MKENPPKANEKLKELILETREYGLRDAYRDGNLASKAYIVFLLLMSALVIITGIVVPIILVR